MQKRASLTGEIGRGPKHACPRPGATRVSCTARSQPRHAAEAGRQGGVLPRGRCEQSAECRVNQLKCH
eukprot:2517181-Lingulodinium_polyedra.AAC.1